MTGKMQERQQRQLEVEVRSGSPIVPMSVSVLENSVTTLSVTSWSSACTSLVMREISAPARRRS